MTNDPSLIVLVTGFIGVMVAVIGTGVAIANMIARQDVRTNQRFAELKNDLTKRIDDLERSQNQMKRDLEQSFERSLAGVQSQTKQDLENARNQTKQDLEKSFDRSFTGVQNQMASMQNQAVGMQNQMTGMQDQITGLQRQMHNMLEAFGKLGARFARIEGILTGRPAGHDETQDDDVRVASGDD